ncbi:Hpt domain-containing protein [Nitrospira moscoviensis]|uniref:Uncharacterized protein n=1 Tax=Nitrospira moscoviensis TaxID=42253 RepID=A0A0K2G851_NITMO|nr:Hpt domain-containing protein [Nitrospira moscoviensis]ALA57110.1 hypothetical protein NITMOv2_0674 [Nitrospira moscoviensis]
MLAQRQLESSAAFQKAILDYAGHAVISTDPDGIIQVFNPAAEALLGYRAEEMIGTQTPLVFYDPEEVRSRAEWPTSSRPNRSDVLAKILALYLKYSAQLADTITRAIAEKNAAALKDAAHSLKSRSATLGARRLAGLCQQLEQAGRTASLDGLDQILPLLTAAFADTCSAFQAELTKRAA